VTSGALAAIAEIAEGLEIDVKRMRANLDMTQGLVMAEAVSMALAEKVGKSEAHHLVEAASRRAIETRQHLRTVLTDDTRVTTHIPAAELEALFDPMGYQGVAQTLIDRLLAPLGTP
jgi:3-carboxy-cis,cis-muconate cycloisomerase